MSVASVVKKMWEVSRTERLDPEQIEKLRHQRLQNLLRHVLALRQRSDRKSNSLACADGVE